MAKLVPPTKLRSEVSFLLFPVVHGMGHFSTGRPEADRVVLIVGDGLRADLLFNLYPFPSIPNSPEIIAPFLRSVVQTRGAFGISHTRVPTESRPGHVAIIAGMYEDVSAVTKGWKTNPVDFDSVFNQSERTFSFGSPDILPMFAKGATPGKVSTWSYDEHEEDFTKDATALDTWVLDRLTELFQNATHDSKLNTELRAPGTVFFLHLLGLDTTGHAYRPHSKEYMDNIIHVDSVVQQTEALFQKFYKADEARTAYIFTADHGMSNVGNHGDGDPDNTRTPLIVWGSGIRKPVYSDKQVPSFAWGLPVEPQDVSQADIAPLMAALLGKSFPVNSVGVLPDIYSSKPSLAFLKNEEASIQASYVNAKVILEHYRVKHELKISRTLAYRPFKSLHKDLRPGELPGSAQIFQIDALMSRKSYAEARQEIASLIAHTLEGLRYLETYDRTLIRIIVTAGYLGWVVYTALLVLPYFHKFQAFHNVEPWKGSRITIRAVFLGILVAMSILFMAHHAPVTYYIYVAFPVYFWSEILIRGLSYYKVVRDERTQSRNLPVSLAMKIIAIITALLSMVDGFAFCRGIIFRLVLYYASGMASNGNGAGWHSLAPAKPVYRLVPVFSPFLMASLLIFKIVSPYIILAAVFANLTARLSLPPFSLFLIAMSLTDGSWLEIGQTISFFCITSLLLVWSAGICILGEWLMRDVNEGFSRTDNEKERKKR
ncbi:hypothetical protein Clacol_007271 [Clathrus columnatus]|uniref:GPI ethanolamine phosphate transferase 1 n=1 Tax=Clathrus columnatus TaxID=1419009 RepID=A0AAV5AEF7_9AGAM|nr:hypothetical protein Clacol_007271 [Clathrus columnatus]